MSDVGTGTRYIDRLLEPFSKGEWLALALMDALTIVGILTGVLGWAWVVITPTVGLWTVHCVYKALEKPRQPQPPRAVAR